MTFPCPCSEDPEVQRMVMLVCHPHYTGFYKLPIETQQKFYDMMMGYTIHIQEQHVKKD